MAPPVLRRGVQALVMPAGTSVQLRGLASTRRRVWKEFKMNSIIYIVGLVVVVLVILSFFGLR